MKTLYNTGMRFLGVRRVFGYMDCKWRLCTVQGQLEERTGHRDEAMNEYRV